MVSHPENGSDSPIGSDRDRGRDNFPTEQSDRVPGAGRRDSVHQGPGTVRYR